VRALAVLGALFAAAAVFIGVEFALGAAHTGEVYLANPCRPRAFHGDVVQRIVLDGLDGAACRLHGSREELVLSLGPGSAFRGRWNRKTIEVAVRAGLLRSVDEAERRGEIPHLLAGPIRKVIRTAPLDQLISGALSLADLF
jgi:hypothetical protein